MYLAPSGPPTSFSTADVRPENVTLSWALPAEEDRNGVIIGYMVTCVAEAGIFTSTITTSDVMATVAGLAPYSSYTCSVSASTSVGVGPPATLNFTSATDGKVT